VPEIYVPEGTNNVALRHSGGDPLQQRVGELVCMESGYYEFFPDLSTGGYWSTWMLRQIADIVDAKNAAWDAQVTKDMEEYEARKSTTTPTEEDPF